MDAKRLEELAEWAGSVARQHSELNQGKLEHIYADLARCAKAWAKVERLRMTVDAMEGGYWRVWWHSGAQEAATAIAAVEAAPEVLDANKG